MPQPQSPLKRRTLYSWKEIATFLGATVRSCQRWEKSAGLPVHRQGGKLKTRIYAHTDELEHWCESGRVAASEVHAEVPVPVPVPLPESDGPKALLDSAATRQGRRISGWMIGVGLAGALALGLGVAFGPALGSLGRRTPAIWRIENSTLTITDAAGRLCWTRQFPGFSRNYEAGVRDKVLIADIDGDGRQEVLLSYLPANLGQDGGSLLCFDSAGRQRWQFRYGSAKSFEGRSFSANYCGRFMRALHFGGKPHLLTIANHYLWYPSQTAVLDPKTGRLEGEYWHPGNIFEYTLYDTGRDGKQGVLLAGINNPGDGLGHASLALLTLPLSHAPQTAPPGDFPALTGGGETAYVLFPTPDLLRATGTLPIPIRVNVDRPGHVFLETPMPEYGGIVYELDSDLNVESVRFSDNFPAAHNRLFQSHLLDHALTGAETECLSKPVRFAAAPDGNSPKLSRFWKY